MLRLTLNLGEWIRVEHPLGPIHIKLERRVRSETKVRVVIDAVREITVTRTATHKPSEDGARP